MNCLSTTSACVKTVRQFSVLIRKTASGVSRWTKSHGERTLPEGDLARIQTWMEERATVLAHRDIDDIHRAVDYLNLTIQRVQSKARADQLEAVTDALILAMHDLRSTLVRQKADRLMKDIETRLCPKKC